MSVRGEELTVPSNRGEVLVDEVLGLDEELLLGAGPGAARAHGAGLAADERRAAALPTREAALRERRQHDAPDAHIVGVALRRLKTKHAAVLLSENKTRNPSPTEMISDAHFFP